MSSEAKTGKTTIEVDMPYTEVTCDGGCGASYQHSDPSRMSRYDSQPFPPPPAHWLVLGHQNEYGAEVWDFCSHRCIATWAAECIALALEAE